MRLRAVCFVGCEFCVCKTWRIFLRANLHESAGEGCRQQHSPSACSGRWETCVGKWFVFGLTRKCVGCRYETMREMCIGERPKKTGGEGELNDFAPAGRAIRDSSENSSRCVSAGWDCRPGTGASGARFECASRGFAECRKRTASQEMTDGEPYAARSGGPDPALECLANNVRN